MLLDGLLPTTTRGATLLAENGGKRGTESLILLNGRDEGRDEDRRCTRPEFLERCGAC